MTYTRPSASAEKMVRLSSLSLATKINWQPIVAKHLQTEALSHGQKVCRLYKQSCRHIQGRVGRNFLQWKFQSRLVRQEFDDNKNLSPEAAQNALEEGLARCKKYRPDTPLNFPLSPGGINYGREVPTFDYVLDAWHPLEKARYPEYFARRDVRKREFIERYEKKMEEKKKKEQLSGSS